MAETTADVRRDIELTRERMSTTLAQLENKLNLMQVVRDHPWPALALAFGAGLALSGSGVDTKATAATLTATRGSSRRIGGVLDELVAQFMTGLHGVVQDRVDQWVTELKGAIGAPTGATTGATTGSGARAYGDAPAGGYGTGALNDLPTAAHGAAAGAQRAD